MKHYLFYIVFVIAYICTATYAGAEPDWMQERAQGQDAAVSHSGTYWFIGLDGKSYRSDTGESNWKPYGARTDLHRIDAGKTGAAALTKTGSLYVTGQNGVWQSTGIRAGDVGIGGGKVWLADAYLKNGQRGTLVGDFAVGTAIAWQEVAGRLTHLDVDPQGRAWGVDKNGDVFVATETGWVEDTKAPKANDIGVGGDGSVFITTSGRDKKLGGGRVYRRDPKNGTWQVMQGRLSAVSATPKGQPFGTNSLGWVISGNQRLQSGNTTQQPETKTKVTENTQSLRKFVGEDLALPASIEMADIAPVAYEHDGIKLGTTWLNGAKTYVAAVTMPDSDVPLLAMAHADMHIGDYMPEAGETAFGDMGILGNPVFFFVDDKNAGKSFSKKDLELLVPLLARDDFPEDGFSSGLTLLSTTDMNNIPAGSELSALLGLSKKQLNLSAELSDDIFLGVEASKDIPAVAPDLTVADLKDKYGTSLFETAKISIQLQDNKERVLGPVTLVEPVLSFGWGDDIEFTLNYGLKLPYRKPDGTGAKAVLHIADVEGVFNPVEKTLSMDGTVTAEKANALIALEGYSFNSAAFEGALKLGDNVTQLPTSLDDFDNLSFSVSGKGQIPSQSRKNVNTDLTVELELDEDDKILVPTLVLESDMTLADIVGNNVPGANKVALMKAKASTDYIEGWAAIDGSPVHAVLYKPAGKAPIIGLEHEEIDLGSYIPKIRNTSLGSFGLANAVFFALPENAEKVEYSALENVPEPLAGVLKKGDYTGLFPLTIHPGITVVGTYSPASDGNAAAVMAVYGIDERGYAVQGHFKLSQLKNLSISKFDPRFSVNKKAVCEKATNVDLSGLDLSFPLPGFTPPYTAGAITFADAEFSLKEIEGQIEPAIITGMNLNLKANDAGIQKISTAAKLSVQGDLNTVCHGVKPDSDVTVSFAASTAFEADKIKDIAFAALSRVTEDGGDETEMAKDIGWKKPFGLPYLTIRQYASSGTFAQKQDEGETKRTLSFKTWTDSKVDKADLDLFGSMEFSINEKEKRLDIEDWSFKAPGPIALKDLPGLDKFPKVNEFSLRDIDLTPEEMIGTLDWTTRQVTATAYLGYDAQENAADRFSIFTRFNSLNPRLLSEKLPKSMQNMELSPAVIGWGNQATAELKMADAPEKLAPLFAGLVAEDGGLTVAKGLTLAGRATPQKMLQGKHANLFTDYIELQNDIVLLGALEENTDGTLKGEITARLDGMKVKRIPDTTLTFANAELILSNLDGDKIEISSDAAITLPERADPVVMKGTLSYAAESETANSLKIDMTSLQTWNNPVYIPDLQVSNLGLEAEFKRQGHQRSGSFALVGDGVFRKQQGEVKVLFSAENSTFDNAVVSFDGKLKISELMDVPTEAASIADAEITKLLLSKNAVAGDITLKLGGKEISGRGAVIADGGEKALFVRHDNQISVNEIASNIPVPLDQLVLPKGVFVIGSRPVKSFDAGDIVDVIYDLIFDGLVDDDMLAKLEVEDGLMFLTEIDVTTLPTFVKNVLNTSLGVKNQIYVAGSIGGVYGGAPSLGFYTILKNATPSLPSFVDHFFKFKDANMKLFVRTADQGASVDVGVSADAVLKARRLDDPSVVQELDSTFSLTYGVDAAGMSMTAGADVTGLWSDPLGLEGYTLKDPSVSFGVEEKGTTIGIHTERAEFKEDGQTKAFVFDLDTTWAGAVPTDMAVQFSKAKDVSELVVTPVTMARLQNSIFDLVFRSGSHLQQSVLSKLDATAAETMQKFADTLSKANNGVLSLIEKSPLSMIGLKDPYIYFGTPGSSPPYREGVKRPPLGLGLEVEADLIVDTGGLRTNLAGGTYKINLIDGYLVEGSVTPPAPFEATRVSVKGNMPLVGLGKQSLGFYGRLEIPELQFAGLIPARIEGGFDVTRGSILERNASIYADVTVGGVLNRTGTMTLTDKILSFSSKGGCTDIPPLDMSGSLTLGGLTPDELGKTLLTAFKPSVPDPIACGQDIGKVFKEIAEGTYNAGKDLVTDPVGSGEKVVDAGKELVTNPGETLKKADKLAQMPMNASEAFAGKGISLVQMGAEKIPVLGPAGGKLIGAGFNSVMNLKNMALNKLKNNAATSWLAEGLGLGSGLAGEALGTVIGGMSDIASGNMPGMGGSSTVPPAHVNPANCNPLTQYWNDVFKQCFANNSVVLFDESNRPQGKLGECLKINHSNGHADTADLTVGKCLGDPQNQFVLNSTSNQIKSYSNFYTGYNNWGGTGASYCLERLTDGVVTGKRCIYNKKSQQWNYTKDLKLSADGFCLTRRHDNKLFMGACGSANKWSGLPLAPNWNAVEKVAVRGKIRHKNTGLCMRWHTGDAGIAGIAGSTVSGAKISLEDCGAKTGQQDQYIRLRVLNDNHHVELMGARAWAYFTEYGCLSIDHHNNALVRVDKCSPFTSESRRHWAVRAVSHDGRRLLPVGQMPLNDILRHHRYVLKNVSNGKCLVAEKNKPEDKSIGIVDDVKSCTGSRSGMVIGGGSMIDTRVIFSGYQADADAENLLYRTARAEEFAFKQAREKVRKLIYQWLRYNIHAENRRIDQVFKESNVFTTDIKVARAYRKSPGACPSGTYWNQNLKRCSQSERLMLYYHDTDGHYRGCLRDGVKIYPNCNTAGEHDVFINAISYQFDDKGRLRAKNESGQDVCLSASTNYRALPEGQRTGFFYCRDDSMAWSYSPSGELISSDGRCLREAMRETRVYNLARGREYNKRLNEGYKAITAKYNGLYAANIVARDAALDAFRKPLLADGVLSPDEHARLSDEYKRLNDVHKINERAQRVNDERAALRKKLKSEIEFYDVSKVSTMVLADCTTDPMTPGKRRWLPSIGKDFTSQQNLPETAQIALAANDQLCMTSDMFVNGNVIIASCAVENKDQYFAFGGTDKTRFLISSRNSKTCLYDAGEDKVSHRACKANGAEMFLKLDNADGSMRIQNASTGECLSVDDAQRVVQTDCDNASSFKMRLMENANAIQFENLSALQSNPQRTEVAQAKWDAARHRATLLYAGAYIQQADKILMKDENDIAVMARPVIIELDEKPSHIHPVTGTYEKIPAVSVPATKILTLPGFEDGTKHVTFAHARPVEFSDGKPTRDHVSDPYVANYGDWFLWSHMQKVMIVTDAGDVKFELIDQNPAFRKAATFEMVPALSGEMGKHSFRSIAQPTKYLQVNGNKLGLGNNAATASFTMDTAAKWLKSENLNLMDMKPPFREAKPLYKDWKYPDTPNSVLVKDYF